MKKVLIISSSPRKNGNSNQLCKQFEKGALEKGNQVEFINLCDYKINYCKACYSCFKLNKCYQNDDFNYIASKMLNADVILFATPTYFYSMSGQLKVFIDRLVSMYTSVRADIYIFITAADTNQSNLISTLEAIRGLTRDCFEQCEEKGYILASGVTNINQINTRQDYLDQAYKYGKEC